ncbi:MAG TPA: SpoIIE family protein phosphatase, partial [Planctomycetota bacterium]|nr:SpoIIE family protein phosphatase [Planctomycetota bacterium]
LSRGDDPRPPAGAAIRRALDGTYRIERVGGGDEALLVNGEDVRGAALHHGDLISFGGATLIFDCDEVGKADTQAATGVQNAPGGGAARRGAGPAAGPGTRRKPTPDEPVGPFKTPYGEEAPGTAESIRYRRKVFGNPGAAIRGMSREDEPHDRLAVLLNVSTTVGATLDLAALLTRLLDLVFQEIPADRGTILLFDRAGKKLRSMVSKRRSGGEGAVRVSRTIIKEALSKQESILTVDAMRDERFHLRESIASAGIRAAMCVPIIRDGRALGVIHLDTGGEEDDDPVAAGAFSREDVDLLTAIASVVSLAIENARFYQEAAERERLRTELALASSIQQRLLPKGPPRTPDLDVYGRTIPAKELGGDIFDFIEDEARQTLHVVVGDVSGKGVGAGLVMAMARSYLRPLAMMFPSPKPVLVRANELLYEDTARDMFMSAVLLRWDGEAKRLVYCGAGQEHLLIVRAGADRCEAIPAGGVALMMLEDAHEFLEDRELELGPGDLVLLYS